VVDYYPVGLPTAGDPQILGTGRGDITHLMISICARHPEGRDADYLKWHCFDHRPEMHRIRSLRASMRLVATPQCRALRTCWDRRYVDADHVLTYFFDGLDEFPTFVQLTQVLKAKGRTVASIPSVQVSKHEIAAKIAVPGIKAGADVLPWYPARSVYLLIEAGEAPADSLLQVPGVAGIWWTTATAEPVVDGREAPAGARIYYIFGDENPEVLASRVTPTLDHRRSTNDVKPFLEGPYHLQDPMDFDRYLP
jgi:hypothetical protein